MNQDISLPESEEYIIEAKNLSRYFGSLKAVDNLSIGVKRSEIFGFLGPNGAGKSTLIRMLVGLLSPSSGSVDVLGYSMPGKADLLRSKVGYMTQKFSLYEDLTVEENLDFAAEIFGLDKPSRRKRIKKVVEEFGLESHTKRKPATLSGGWKQRLALATATVHNPQLLFLDEPTAGVDPDSRRLFWEKLFDLAADGVTILVSTHYMDEAVRCHRLCLIQDGQRRALDSPENLKASLSGRIVEVKARPLDKILNHLLKKNEIISATQLGNRLHILLPAEGPSASQAARSLNEELENMNFTVNLIEEAEPNLEDVFVAVTHGEKL